MAVQENLRSGVVKVQPLAGSVKDLVRCANSDTHSRLPESGALTVGPAICVLTSLADDPSTSSGVRTTAPAHTPEK